MPLLSVRNVSKSFNGVMALDKVNFDLENSEIHALCGENGAGKSTLMKILSGLYPYGDYNGEIYINEVQKKFHSTQDSHRSGVAIVYQELSLCPNLSVAENVFLGREFQRFGILSKQKLFDTTKNFLVHLGLNLDPNSKIEDLSLGERQLVEITRALSHSEAKVLILDEPTSALSETETMTLLAVLKRLKTKGLGIILISHRLREVYQVADKITVLRDGQSLLTKSPLDLSERDLIEAMVGRKISDHYPPKSKVPSGKIKLEVLNWSVNDRQRKNSLKLKNVNLKLFEGEILGLAGMMGSGRSELLLSIMGAIPIETGQLKVNGVTKSWSSPHSAWECGLALLTEDRMSLGLLLESNLLNNLTLASLKKYTSFGRVKEPLRSTSALQMLKALKIKSKIKSNCSSLSGGGQQKVILGRCLDNNPEILLLDEPTRGIDVGAKQEIYGILQDLSQKGFSILLTSSEITELIGICHRVIVLCDGSLTREFHPNAIGKNSMTEENILEAALSTR